MHLSSPEWVVTYQGTRSNQIPVGPAMSAFLLISSLVLWAVVLFFGFMLLGALRAVALLRWRLEQLEATTPSRLGRSGLRVGKKAPGFKVPAISNGDITLDNYIGRKLLLVFMQPGCGSCHQIVPDLNQLQDAGEMQVVVVHNGDEAEVKEWIKKYRPRFPVALQERYSLSKGYEVFATPFAFLIDERGVIASRGIVSTKQYLGFVLNRAGYEDKESDGEAADSERHQGSAADAREPSLSHSKGG
jgi:methylamine dehydrogenase accessory protein MauD